MARRKLSVKSPPSLASVAKTAGVSTATVSLVLSGRHKDYGVSSDTAERIRVIADKQGYQRPTRRRGPPRLHIVHFEDFVRMEERGLGGSVLHPLIENLSTHGWQTSIDTRLPSDPPAELLSASAVVVPVNHGYDTKAKALIIATTQAGVQAVVLGRVFDDVTAIYVDGDQMGGGRLVAEFLLGQGHRYIALIGGISGDPHSEARLKGFTDVAKRTCKLEPWGNGQYTIADAHRLVVQRLAEGLRPTAIFCVSDRMALGALLALREAGLAVPQDVSLVGFDDQTEFTAISPRLSTIRLVADGVGARLANLLEPATTPSRQDIILPARLIVRGSTAVPKEVL